MVTKEKQFGDMKSINYYSNPNECDSLNVMLCGGWQGCLLYNGHKDNAKKSFELKTMAWKGMSCTCLSFAMCGIIQMLGNSHHQSCQTAPTCMGFTIFSGQWCFWSHTRGSSRHVWLSPVRWVFFGPYFSCLTQHNVSKVAINWGTWPGHHIVGWRTPSSIHSRTSRLFCPGNSEPENGSRINPASSCPQKKE